VSQQIAHVLVSQDPAVIRQALSRVSGNPRLMQALRGAEEYLARALGPAANENVAQPVNRGVFGGARSAAASDGQPDQKKQR
jgi:hypothetical protein